tara:strand:+ start:13158 stop:13826 length:669 start_codon:yes stop_codon:yes gene_type:complete
MDDIINDYYETRKHILHKNSEIIKKKHELYIENKKDANRLIAVLLGKLIDLKYEFEIKKDVKIEKISNIKENIAEINKLISDNYYCIYRSPQRNMIDTNSVRNISTELPSNITINIDDCKNEFIINNKKIQSVLVNSKKHINVDENTIIEMPSDMLLLPNDSITIEYLDVFYYMDKNGDICYKKYNGYNKRAIYNIGNIIEKRITIESLDYLINTLFDILKK